MWNTYILQNDYHSKISYTSIISYNYLYLCVVKTFKIYSLNNFRVYNIVLLTIITMLCIASPELFHLIMGNLYPLANIYPFPHIPVPGNHHSTPSFCEFSFFRFHRKGKSYSICFLSAWNISVFSRSIHVFTNVSISSFLMAEYYPIVYI